jgi:outer membrane protein, heavy metal efflux system
MILKFLLYRIFIFSFVLLFFQGCYFHDSLVLNPDEIIMEVSHNRRHLATQPVDENLFTLQDAALWMSKKNPKLSFLRTAYRGSSKVADTWAPLPNPRVESGVAVGFNLDKDQDERAVMPFVALGFTIPLGPRLSRKNTLNDVMKDHAFNTLLTTHRELYLNLRRRYITYIVSRERLKEQKQIVVTAENTRRVGSKLLDLGIINSLGVNSIFIDYNSVVLDKIDREVTLVNDTGDLAELMGVSSDLFEQKNVISLPQLSEKLPDMEELKKIMLKNSTSLSRLETQYKVDDSALRLELARQVPDLGIGVGYEPEVGELKQVLESGVGMDLPIFDRNQQSIIESKNKRDQTALAYKTEMNKALTRLESGTKRYNLYFKQYKEIESHLIPLSIKNIKSAERALKIGSLDILLFLELQTKHRDLLIKQIDLKKSLWDALVDIEEITGYPLYLFPDEKNNLTLNLQEEAKDE